MGKAKRHFSKKYEQYYGEPYKVKGRVVKVTEPTGSRLRYKIEDREGRYDGLTIWQTKQCGPSCQDFRYTSLQSVFGICTKGVAWKVIMKNKAGRRLRACQVNRVNHQLMRNEIGRS